MPQPLFSLHFLVHVADGKESAWDPLEPPPARRTEAELQEAMSMLKAADLLAQQGDNIGARELKQQAAKHGLVDFSYLSETGLRLVDGVVYDGMHSVANSFKLLRDAVMGHGLLHSANLHLHLAYEADVNGRYVEACAALQSGTAASGKDLRIQGLLPYVFSVLERAVVQERGHRALIGCYVHASFKGSRVFQAFNSESDKGYLCGLKAADSHIWLGPVGKYIFAGMAVRDFKVADFSSTHEAVYFKFFDAMNNLRKKELTQAEAATIFEHAVEAVSELYLVLPAFECNHSLHQVLEVAKQLPMHVTANWAGERNMRTVRANNHNEAHPGATIINALQRYLGLWTREMANPRHVNIESALTPALADLDVVQDWDDQVLPARQYSGKIPAHLGGRTREIKQASPHMMASLWMHYLKDTSWHGAAVLHKLVEWFVEDGGDDPAEVDTPSRKLAAIDALRRWFDRQGTSADNWHEPRQQRSLDARHRRVLGISRRYTERSRARVGEFSLRSARLDEPCTTVASYFLAKVGGGALGWTYEMGRAVAFVRHTPPGCNPGEDDVLFVQAKWLIPVTPSHTARSKLPMMVLDNAPHRYLGDGDVQDATLTDIWPLASIEASPVCLLPLDEAHDVPSTVAVTRGPIAVRQEARTQLQRYRRRTLPDNLADVGRGLVLAAVICTYSSMNEHF